MVIQLIVTTKFFCLDGLQSKKYLKPVLPRYSVNYYSYWVVTLKAFISCIIFITESIKSRWPAKTGFKYMPLAFRLFLSLGFWGTKT